MIQWKAVTWYSKLGAIIFFIGILPAAAFSLGIRYQETLDATEAREAAQEPPALSEVAANRKKFLAEIEEKGLETVARHFAEDDLFWPTYYEALKAGEADWIRISYRLYKSSDLQPTTIPLGSYGLFRDADFASALNVNPTEVFRIMKENPPFSSKDSRPSAEAALEAVRWLCVTTNSQPLDVVGWKPGDERPSGTDESFAELVERRAAVRKVDDPSLADMKVACLEQIDGQLRQLATYIASESPGM